MTALIVAAAAVVSVIIMGLGLGGAFLKAVHEHGKSTGELTSAIAVNTQATQHLSDVVERMGGTLQDHEIRIVRLEK